MTRKNSQTGKLLGLLLVAGFTLCSCHDESGHWVVIDNVHAPVDSIIVSDQVAASDTLLITFEVESAWIEMYSACTLRFTHLEIDRQEGSGQYEVWADLLEWEGNAAIPPCCGCGFIHEHEEPPPFTADEFLIIVHQPGGTTLEKAVTIVP